VDVHEWETEQVRSICLQHVQPVHAELQRILQAAAFELPGEFVIASPEHPLRLVAPDGTLRGSGIQWRTYLGALFNDRLEETLKTREPENLYAPVNYIMGLGGKRIRPALALMSCHLFGSEPSEAFGAAMAVEMFHNFTLIHDDIMDRAELRRGKMTVHKKWDLNAGILSGDVLMILSYQQLEDYEPPVLPV